MATRSAPDAAGDRDVLVIGGASIIRQLLAAGLVDELAIDVMPVLLGGGLRLFEDGALPETPLEKLEVSEFGPRMALRFRIGPAPA